MCLSYYCKKSNDGIWFRTKYYTRYSREDFAAISKKNLKKCFMDLLKLNTVMRSLRLW